MSVGVAILGSTGSIGQSTLQVLARQRDRFHVAALTAHSNADLLARQAAEWSPSYVGLVNGDKGEPPGAGTHRGSQGRGPDCLVEAATRPDVQIVVNGIVGAAGLAATLAALRAGKRVALANKETLVMAGELVTRAARVTSSPAITRVSLFAKATRLPARSAASVASSPAAPTIPFTTICTSGRVAASTRQCGPRPWPPRAFPSPGRAPLSPFTRPT